MLVVPSFVSKSEIHGFGCFSFAPIPARTLVWIYDPNVDRLLDGHHSHWERLHAYGSNARGGRLILPGDNSAWINFSENPNLFEAELIGGEHCLRALVDIKEFSELTVATDTDTDYEWKLNKDSAAPI